MTSLRWDEAPHPYNTTHSESTLPALTTPTFHQQAGLLSTTIQIRSAAILGVDRSTSHSRHPLTSRPKVSLPQPRLLQQESSNTLEKSSNTNPPTGIHQHVWHRLLPAPHPHILGAGYARSSDVLHSQHGPSNGTSYVPSLAASRWWSSEYSRLGRGLTRQSLPRHTQRRKGILPCEGVVPPPISATTLLHPLY